MEPVSFQIPIVHLPRSITFASYIAFSASKGSLTLTGHVKSDHSSVFAASSDSVASAVTRKLAK